MLGSLQLHSNLSLRTLTRPRQAVTSLGCCLAPRLPCAHAVDTQHTQLLLHPLPPHTECAATQDPVEHNDPHRLAAKCQWQIHISHNLLQKHTIFMTKAVLSKTQDTTERPGPGSATHTFHDKSILSKHKAMLSVVAKPTAGKTPTSKLRACTLARQQAIKITHHYVTPQARPARTVTDAGDAPVALAEVIRGFAAPSKHVQAQPRPPTRNNTAYPKRPQSRDTQFRCCWTGNPIAGRTEALQRHKNQGSTLLEASGDPSIAW